MGKISNEMTCFLTRAGFRIYFYKYIEVPCTLFLCLVMEELVVKHHLSGGFNPQVVTRQRGVDRYHHYDDNSTGCSTAFFVMLAAVDNSSGLLKGHKGHQLPFL